MKGFCFDECFERNEELGEETFESGWSKHWDLQLTCGGNMAFGIGTLSSFHVPNPTHPHQQPTHSTPSQNHNNNNTS